MEKEEDFLFDEIEYDQIIEGIRTRLPQELKERFSDDELTYFIDVMDEYYVESGILEEQPDEEGYVNVDLEEITRYVVKEAKKDGIGEFDPEDIFLIVQAESDFEESQIPEE